DLKRMVVIRSPSSQLVPFKLHRFGQQRHDMVKATIFLKEMADLEAVNAVYREFFPGYLPARTVFGVSELPAGALVQIDAVMSNAESTPPQA
ncbi:RidA family protein, partial [Aeromonas allosaccharophila]|uniref:RidA family protein n=1 Tax=Aeromonas allosaccharophila TaxID=656 RepID=UPI00111718E7